MTRHLRHLAEVTGAAAVTVYAPVPWTNGTPLLVHFGGAAVPELASLAAAEAFAARADRGAAAPPPPPWSFNAVPSAADDGILLPVPLLSSLWAGGISPPVSVGPGRRHTDRTGAAATPVGWVGLRLQEDDGADRLAALGVAMPLARALASAIVGLHGALTDPLTGLPGRQELDVLLGADLQLARRHGLPCGLVLVNPLGLDEINVQHGRNAGDAVLREVVRVLRDLMRRTDAVMRHGGAIFALPLGAATEAHTAIVAERVRSHIAGHGFLDGSVRLACAVGAASCEGADLQATEPIDLLRRAADALGAARDQHGERVVVWHESDGLPATSPDRLLGIFTGRADKDYRNMGLLWDVLQVLSSTQGATELARLVVERLATLVRAERTGLFVTSETAPRLLAGHRRVLPGEGAGVLADDDIADDERALVAEAVSAVMPKERTLRGDGGPRRGVAVPLVTGERVLARSAWWAIPKRWISTRLTCGCCRGWARSSPWRSIASVSPRTAGCAPSRNDGGCRRRWKTFVRLCSTAIWCSSLRP